MTWLLCGVLAMPAADVGPLVQSVWLLHLYGTAAAVDPAHDPRLKAILAGAIVRDGVFTPSDLAEYIEPTAFDQIAGGDGVIAPDDIERALALATPASRDRLVSSLRAHLDYLTTTFDALDEPQRKAGRELAEWIVANHEPGQPVHVTCVCTGNSRRSLLGAAMGNLAAAYYGMPEIHFHSGGTAPTACNRRTIAKLTAIGFDIEATGGEARRGDPATANPIYRMRWGTGLETREFSKHYADPSNPQEGFAALMICSEADAECPVVAGAALRVSLPLLDPKMYDDGAYEAAKYAERRDDLGRFMLSVLVQARRGILSAPSAAR